MDDQNKDPRATDWAIWLPLYLFAGLVDFVQIALTMTGVGIIFSWVVSPVASFIFWLWFKIADIPVGLAKQGVALVLDYIPIINWVNNTALVFVAQQTIRHPGLAGLAQTALGKRKQEQESREEKRDGELKRARAERAERMEEEQRQIDASFRASRRPPQSAPAPTVGQEVA